MKKFLLVIAIVASLFVVSVKAISLPEVTDHEKVTIYMFRGHGCSHCYDALVYLYQNLDKYSDYIEFKAFEVWYDTTNKDLMVDAANALGEEVSGVPLFIIGDSYASAGFGAKTGDTIIETALKEYENKKYKDVVAKVIKDNKYKVTAESLKEAAEQEGINDEILKTANQPATSESGGKYDTIIIIGIFVVIIGGVAALVLTNRKNA